MKLEEEKKKWINQTTLKTSQGLPCDFHTCRYSCGSWIAHKVESDILDEIATLQTHYSKPYLKKGMDGLLSMLAMQVRQSLKE